MTIFIVGEAGQSRKNVCDLNRIEEGTAFEVAKSGKEMQQVEGSRCSRMRKKEKKMFNKILLFLCNYLSIELGFILFHSIPFVIPLY